MTPMHWPSRSAMPARSSSGDTRPRPSATTSPAPTTSCRPPAAPALPRASVSSTSSNAARWCAATLRVSRRSLLRRSASPRRKAWRPMHSRCRSGSTRRAGGEPTTMGDANGPWRIGGLTLDEHTVVRRSPDIEHERAVAIFDLLEENHFAPVSGCSGPYHLHLAIEENRLSIEIRSMANGANETITLPLAPFRGIVKDYFMVCDSYYEAIRRSSLAQIEAIDVGRRSLHNEGSALLIERLAHKVEIDLGPARRPLCSPPHHRAAWNCCAKLALCPTASIRPTSTRPPAAVSCLRHMRCASRRKRHRR